MSPSTPNAASSIRDRCRTRALRPGPIAVIALVVLVGASACVSSQPFSDSSSPKLQFNGDSITQQAMPEINAHYGPDYDVGIYAAGMASTVSMQAELAAEAALAPDIEIVNLGGMDALFVDGGNETLGDTLARYDAIAGEFPSSTCLIFVNLNTHVLPAAARAINDHLAGDPTRFPHVVDWDGAWQPGYFYAVDDVHPNEVGRLAMIALEDAAIATCP